MKLATPPISEADLMLNADGSIYHLNVLPEEIADTIITVGDPDRVDDVSRYFDHIEFKKAKREFITHTGTIGKKRVTVVSTGIGTDNIDIVLNELDALANIDFTTRLPKKNLKSLEIIRIGTSGAIQEDIPVDSIVVSEYALGLDTIMQFYIQNITDDEQYILQEIKKHFHLYPELSPYMSTADHGLLKRIGHNLLRGITITAPGFYSPQGRQVRAQNAIPNLIHLLQTFHVGEHRFSNLEMETAGIYGLSAIFGHRALSVNAIIATRINKMISKEPQAIIDKAIKLVLERL
ncbi:MAG: nucleoside phosphorylase [Sphingobacteriaceae bacterium]